MFDHVTITVADVPAATRFYELVALHGGFRVAETREGYTRFSGGPSERPQYHPGYYGAFVLDPDGSNVEIVDHRR